MNICVQPKGCWHCLKFETAVSQQLLEQTRIQSLTQKSLKLNFVFNVGEETKERQF